MGCGKSSVGRELSKLLCCPFMDLDDVIEERSGRRIPEIFATDGEAEFRRMEKDALELVFNTQEIRQNSGHVHHADTPHDQADTPDPSVPVSAVVALGGGTVMTKKCAEMVHEKTLCIYLRASIETLVSHLEGESSGRPMLQGAPLDVISSEGDLHSVVSSEGEAGVEKSPLRSRIEDLMARRASTYEKTAHIIIDTDGKSISDISREISDYFHAGHTILFDRISGEADIL